MTQAWADDPDDLRSASMPLDFGKKLQMPA